MEIKIQPYTRKIEKRMQLFYKNLNEKDRRHYAAIEAYKLGHGGISYISELFDCSRQTIHSGLEELEKNDFLDPMQIRHEGGGRKDSLQKCTQIEEIFLKVIEEHIAGDPMNDNIRWVKLTRAEVSEKMNKLGVKVSRNIVRKLRKKHNLVKRKMQRKRPCGQSTDRDNQFKNIAAKKAIFLKSNNPIISVDTKKKENFGNLHRKGSVYCTQPIESFDHDYSYLSDGKFIPHGIYDMKKNKAHINIGVNNETAEFICDSLETWWLRQGVKAYPNAKKILILCDAGGANSYRHNIFKVELQRLSNKINMILQIAHYPPYTSKWNPIEHRVFPHVTRSIEGAPIHTVEEAKQIIKATKTKTGLIVTTNVIKKTYRKGKEVAKDFMKDMKIKFDESLGKFNYTISPLVT